MSVNTSEEYLDELLQAIEPIIQLGEPQVVTDELPETEVEEMSIEPVAEVQDETMSLEEENDSAINDLLASLSDEEIEAPDEGVMSEEDVEFMLNAVSSQAVQENVETAYDEDVKELLKQFTEDEDLSDIQDILEKNDNGEALDNAMLDVPDVEVFQLEEENDEEETNKENKFVQSVGKIIAGVSALFKKRKKKRTDKEDSELLAMEAGYEALSEEMVEAVTDADADMDITEVESMSLDDLFDEEEDVLVLDEDLSDIEQLLSGGAFEDEEGKMTDDTAVQEENIRTKKDSKNRKGKKQKKDSFFAKVLNLLTEEIDEPDKKSGTVPEADKTGVTQENLNILEELSEEDKKKTKKAQKEEKKNKKSKKNGKDSSKKGESDDEDNGKEADGKNGKKAKKAKKKREKKEKPRKVEVITKPEKKLPKKRVLSTLALCLSILAAILILQNVVHKSDNLKEAKYAYDHGDYVTCFTNLEMADRSEEEEELYQKSRIILSVQRKWDSYNNFYLMGYEVEALNSLLEGVREYRSQEDLALESGVHAQITVIYQDILEVLQRYGLSQNDIEEILGYESKVTYTKRLDSIVNGTPFIIDNTSDEQGNSEPQPLQDVLPGEEDFLPDDTTRINDLSTEEVQDLQETVVVGSNPTPDFEQEDSISFDEPIVTGGQNVGNGSTNISSEVTGQSVIVGVR